MIRIGTRGSKLALRQAALVQEALLQVDSQIATELVILHTRGDRIQDRPISEIGEKGIFATELEQALIRGQIDLAVHSAKDLPMKLADGLVIAAVLPRADVRDVLVVPKGGRTPFVRQEMDDGCGMELFKSGTVQYQRHAGDISCPSYRIGSGSRRRQMLAGMVWEHVICEEIRGNVDTRLRKLKEGSYDGILLAKAGLDRLGIGADQEKDFDFYPLSPEVFLPAACQGIIAVEALQDSEIVQICRKMTDKETELCYLVEREALAQLSADCSEAAAAWCRRMQNQQTCEAVCVTAERDHEAVCVTAEQDHDHEAVCATGGLCTESADNLILDVMYAQSRVRLACPAIEEEGRQLACQAAKMVRAKKAEGR